jgi:hypothetical protein
MVDFRLNDDGGIELQQFGEETDSFIWEHCYPALQQVLAKEIDPDPDTPPDVTATIIKNAVDHERTRLWDEQTDGLEARTPVGRRLTDEPRAVGSGTDHQARQRGPVKRRVQAQRTSRTRCSGSGWWKPRG